MQQSLALLFLFAALGLAAAKAPVDCAAVLCAAPECGPCRTLVTPKGECCPVCRRVDWGCSSSRHRCSENVSCPEAFPTCTESGRCVLETPRREMRCAANQRCPDRFYCNEENKCVIDCRTVRCALPQCGECETLVTSPFECCATCRPKPRTKNPPKKTKKKKKRKRKLPFLRN